MKKHALMLPALALSVGMAFHVEAASLSNRDAIRLSYDALQARSGQFGIQSARDEFQPKQVTRDGLGQVHVRMDQYYRGLPVFGEQLITHFDGQGRLLSVNGTVAHPYELNLQPKISAQKALDLAQAEFGQETSTRPQVQLSVVRLDQGGTYLAWMVKLEDIQSDTPASWTYFINARTGLIEWDFDSLETTAAVGVGHSLYVGDVRLDTDQGPLNYTLLDSVRGKAQTTDMKNGTSGNGVDFTDDDNDWGNSKQLDRASAAVDAHFGVGLTWDFYKTNFGRNGIKDDGKGALSRVHYSVNYVNAFWSDSCFCMTYGDGDGSYASPLVSLDVAAHEMTHGVTAATAGLVYSNQSGGLNESWSDIMGTAVEYFAVATGVSTVPEYWIGEDIWTPSKAGDALRYMDDPRKDGKSIDHARQYKRGMDVHYSSGLANNVFYLLSNGGTNSTSGQSVVGIGIDKAQQIFYRALVTYMNPRTDFAGAGSATFKAATDLYGAADAATVKAAWAACGVTF